MILSGLHGLLASDTGVSADARRYWRIYVTAIGATNYADVLEIQMRAGAGGADQCILGSSAAYASTVFSGLPASNAFDDNFSTAWSADGSALPQWIAYDFIVPVDVLEVAVSSARASVLTRSFKDFKIQSSPDNSTWTDIWTVSGQLAWSASEVRIFTKP